MAQTQTGGVTATAPLSGTTALTFTSAAALNITTRSWRTLGRLRRELDWTKPDLEYALQNGLRYRTTPPGVVIDWRAFRVLRTLDVEHSTVRLRLGDKWRDVGVKVLPPDDAEVPSSLADAPAASSASPREVSGATTGKGHQAHRVQMALGRLRDRGLVLSQHMRPELRRRIGKELDAEARRTGSSDPLPSRQVMDKVLKAVGVK
jgi:hypothetical protein